MAVSTEEIRDNYLRAKERIDRSLSIAGEPGRRVRIMAVTKTHQADTVKAVIRAGISLLGENRVSEGGRKVKALGKDSAEYHMIGPLHTGEVRQAIRDFHWIDSVDRMKIAAEIARRTVKKDLDQPGLLVEVNTSGEGSKHGFPPDRGELEEVLGKMDEMGLTVSGLMTVGPLNADRKDISAAFALLRELRDSLRSVCDHDLKELSMGMSEDFELAVREGATVVRLGRYLLGPRRKR
ncbi:MAG: YggS family pyridoxal phosphate-dependent enzyme [Candidatus Aegiribacteria sp.]|nr:YggS family pyridoxal phosphate-dependent enzyme [Candidatus Aegiribacteria sp.]MBD3295222.1 YggS family pyridoxal phosphate-dependent enzyme [Candidatus Fermentibacteria bacterium]